MDKEINIHYHDEEWGIPLHDDLKLFEFLCLESFQAGLSWEIILKKRENFRRAFSGFDPEKVALFNEKDVEKLMQDKSIVRNLQKIKATINNARCFLKIQEGFGSFDAYIWSFVDNKPIINAFRSLDELPAKTELSEKISKDMKKLGFKFLGPTVIYAHMQATGMVNDHFISCFRYKEIIDSYK